MKEGLILLNERSQVLSINPMAQRLFETDERCVGEDFLTVERSPEVSAAIQTALQSGYCELQLARGNTSISWTSVRSAPAARSSARSFWSLT